MPTLMFIPLVSSGKYAAELRGGLNLPQIEKCEQECEKQTHENRKADDRSLLSCSSLYIPKIKSCDQYRKLDELSGGTPYNFKKYELVTVFEGFPLTNGPGPNFIMVDTKGNFISLYDKIKIMGLITNKNYQLLKNNHKNITISAVPYYPYSYPNADVSPSYRISPNKNMQIIFKLALFNGPCRGCSTIGIAEIAYEFNVHGEFVARQLIKITPWHLKNLVHDICCN